MAERTAGLLRCAKSRPEDDILAVRQALGAGGHAAPGSQARDTASAEIEHHLPRRSAGAVNCGVLGRATLAGADSSSPSGRRDLSTQRTVSSLPVATAGRAMRVTIWPSSASSSAAVGGDTRRKRGPAAASS
ncbi:MAG: hypothetical protein FJ197_11880 [Gammaproteobacteria bacterium]|nr:hypothetical protein [Gammaproteobacteria bacterium]